MIKFITVRMDEEEKRLAKVKALRDSKVKRSAQPIAQPPVAISAAEASEPAAVAEAPAVAEPEAVAAAEPTAAAV